MSEQAERLADVVNERARAHGVEENANGTVNLNELARLIHQRIGEHFPHATLRNWVNPEKQLTTPRRAKLEQFARGVAGNVADGAPGPSQSYDEVMRRLWAAVGRPLPSDAIEANPRFANLRTDRKQFVNELITALDVSDEQERARIYEEVRQQVRAELRAELRAGLSTHLHAVLDDETRGPDDGATG